jgi:hypothetical protein
MAATLRKKLQLKDGQALRVLGAPEGVDLSEVAEGEPVGVLAFVSSSADLRKHAKKIAGAAADASGLAWAAYPKKSSGIESDLTRDEGWAALFDTGVRPVRQIAIDDTWSALRFRRQEHVAR